MTKTAYSRETIVAAITSYYEFLQRIHSDYNAIEIKYPPTGGWPEITPEPFNMYSESAVDLLRHLPYFDSEGLCIVQKTEAVDYTLDIRIRFLAKELDARKAAVEEGVEKLTLEESPDDIDQGYGENGFPSYMVELAIGNRDGPPSSSMPSEARPSTGSMPPISQTV
jgi:hypothetical protein